MVRQNNLLTSSTINKHQHSFTGTLPYHSIPPHLEAHFCQSNHAAFLYITTNVKVMQQGVFNVCKLEQAAVAAAVAAAITRTHSSWTAVAAALYLYYSTAAPLSRASLLSYTHYISEDSHIINDSQIISTEAMKCFVKLRASSTIAGSSGQRQRQLVRRSHEGTLQAFLLYYNQLLSAQTVMRDFSRKVTAQPVKYNFHATFTFLSLFRGFAGYLSI